MNIIFDIDGTLWNTTEIIAHAWQKAVDATGISKTRLTGAMLKKEFGKTMDVIAADVFPDVTDEKLRDELIGECINFEQEALDAMTEEEASHIVFDGVYETMADLSSRNRLFIVSNCQIGYIELFMKKSNTTDFILDHLCYGETLTGKGESILKLIERNSLDKKECIYVGDTLGDFEACTHAGINMIFCKYGFGEVPSPYASINDIKDLRGMY